MNSEVMKVWLQLSDRDRRDIFTEVSATKNLPSAAIEKDWWVVRTLELVFASSIAAHVVFKGGTSLSKAWGLIDRFSEDIDLALDRKLLGFDKADRDMTGSQVSKLRRRSFQFISETFFPEIREKFQALGFTNVNVQLGDIKNTDQDPLIIEIYYPTVTDAVPYLRPRVIIELGSRSLMEPHDHRRFTSLVGEQYSGRPFADTPITVPTVTPERTFLEKIFLLHEEFQLPGDRIRVERKSRHLYDLEKLMDTPHATAALANKELYQTIVEHRKALTPLRGIDYANHIPAFINPVPPDTVIRAWEEDYKAMQESMLYNPSRKFTDLIARIQELKDRINALPYIL
ncbi:MAG: nucleotidyl transferase AbiEii/AbiGii toxin family protein [Saprospiraceae bacterium]|nr:nucleotidyl transferase AbiEii/AbiGii toxin family protein [Saprospiraceae bacterium]